MVIAALLVFAALLVAWLIAPPESPDAAVTSEPAEAEPLAQVA